ncbi:hypothetical protein HXX76_000557 [Chlamydomonas incerta]|uniref:BZIP domain-containing protein n=1 Tax=Chlamydomonas incerta TaxID=51695 RepID=A0A835WET3_CHLIN|nr:hypothetical protein HXX76_000557 [Chlamydomonas incerta]|eukprot:KAG2445954.1 hypothetical protein HXX76_000557 [Chlamydomonas incerta]
MSIDLAPGPAASARNLAPPLAEPPLLGSLPTRPAPRRVAQAASSPSNSDTGSPPRISGGVSVSAKEKNRQAQRRFRERQKDLIHNLKAKVEDLTNRVAESEKEISLLREENAMLRGRVDVKQHVGAGLPSALQSLLQMTSAEGAATGSGLSGLAALRSLGALDVLPLGKPQNGSSSLSAGLPACADLPQARTLDLASFGLGLGQGGGSSSGSGARGGSGLDLSTARGNALQASGLRNSEPIIKTEPDRH